MISPPFKGSKKGKNIRKWIEERSARETARLGSIQRMNFRISSGGIGSSIHFTVIYIIKAEGVKSYFYRLVQGLQTTISGSQAILVWATCTLKYHNRFCIAKTCDFSNLSKGF
jgi:hypothetical protein